MRNRFALMIAAVAFSCASFLAVPIQAQTSQNTQDMQGPNQGENANGQKSTKTLQGCVVQQGDHYALKKGGLTTILTGADVSAHLGHKVKVHGSYMGDSIGTKTSADASGSGNPFSVTQVDMISDTCK